MRKVKHKPEQLLCGFVLGILESKGSLDYFLKTFIQIFHYCFQKNDFQKYNRSLTLSVNF